jgi:glycine cleavage system H protein
MIDENKLLYAESHEWAAIEGEVCTVGITRFAVEQLTDIVYVELPSVGKSYRAGQPFGVIESVKAVSDLYAPVDGEVIEINNKVPHDPSLLSSDPYNAGWMVKFKVAPGVDTSKLMAKAKYEMHAAASHH